MTDSNGGHYDRQNGGYHYHHGYPAHDHPNGVCPYENTENTETDEFEESEITETDEFEEDEYYEKDNKSIWSTLFSGIKHFFRIIFICAFTFWLYPLFLSIARLFKFSKKAETRFIVILYIIVNLGICAAYIILVL